MALGHDVGDAHHFEHGAHRAAGDDAVTGLAGAIITREAPCSPVTLWWIVPFLSCTLTMLRRAASIALVHGDRHFLGLALAHADAAVAVTDDGQRGEAEDTATLDHLGDAVDRDHLFLQTVVVAFGLRAGLKLCHFDSLIVVALELQAGFAGRIGQRLDAAVVGETGAVERDLLDAGGLAFSAMRLPIGAAAAALPPLPDLPPSSLRTSASAVEALASTLAPSSEMTLA